MTEERVKEFVDKMVVADQTEMLWWWIGKDDQVPCDGEPSWDDVIFPDVWLPRLRKLKEEEEKRTLFYGHYGRPVIYSWKLINPCYMDLIKGGDMPYFQFEDWENQIWLGITTTNPLTEWQYLKDYVKNLDNE